MSYQNHYQATSLNCWNGRSDSLPNERFFQRIQTVDLRQGLPSPIKGANFALIGFCCDEGVRRNLGRVGAKEGPRAVRQQLGNLALHANDQLSLIDVGDIVCNDGQLEQAQAALGEVVAKLLMAGYQPLVIGGGHEIAWGHYQGIATAFPNERIGIINIDAHLDLRPLLNGQGHSGSPFLQIAHDCQAKNISFSYLCVGVQPLANTRSLFDTAAGLNVEIVTAQSMQQAPEQTKKRIDQFIERQNKIYLTVCLDAIAAAYAPGVSAPQVLGISPRVVIDLIHQVKQSNKMVSFDIAELAPCFDPQQFTAKLAASLLAQFL